MDIHHTEVRIVMNIEGIGSITRQSYQGSASPEVTKSAPVENVTPAENVEASIAAEVPVVVESARSSAEGSATDANQEATETTQSQSERIKKAVDEINKNSLNQEAVFGIHEKTNRVTIKIVDKQTKKVIKEFPPEKTLDMIAKAWEMAGIMVDERR